MPSLAPTTGSASALLKTANSLANTVANYQDSVQALEYANSAYTDTAFQAYQNYLAGRLKTVSSLGGISNASKALTLSKTIESAMHSNISASITRANIQIMAGNATPTDKYNLISSQYVRAVNNQDFTLAQSLESQAYSLSQTIQNNATTAAAAATTLAKANNAAQATGQEGVATKLESALKQFNSDFASVGQKNQQGALDSFVKSIQPQLDALHVVLPKGATPNYFDITKGIVQAIYQAHSYASLATAQSDPTASQAYANKANDIVTGATKFGTNGGSLTYAQMGDQANQLQAGNIAYNATTGEYGKKPLDQLTLPGSTATGFNINTNGGVGLQTSPNAFVAPPPQLGAQLTALGLQFDKTNTGNPSQGIQVQVSKDTIDPKSGKTIPGSPDFLQKVAPAGTLLNVFQVWNNATKQYDLQFKGDATDGPGSSVYTIVRDGRGLPGLYESNARGDTILGGAYGFNQNTPGVSNNGKGFFASLLATAKQGLSGFASMFGDAYTPQGAVNQSAMIQSSIAAGNAAAQAQLTMAKPPALQPLAVAPPPAPATPKALQAPTIRPLQATPSAQILQPTASPQQTGGGLNLNQSGGTIAGTFSGGGSSLQGISL